MELKDVVEVITASSVKTANDLLKKGWTLLAVVAGDGGPDFVFGRKEGSPKLAGKKTVSEILGDSGL